MTPMGKDRSVTVHEMLSLLQTLITQRRGGIVGVQDITPQDGDWLLVQFANGQQLAVTVEEVE